MAAAGAVAGAVAAGVHTSLLRVYACAAGFWLLFSAYLSAQLLQTAVNGGSGYECLFTIYSLFAASALLAPHAIGLLRPRYLIPIGALPYCGMVLATAFPPSDGLIVACGAVGIAAAFLWSSQGLYLSQCANRMVAIDPSLRLSNANIKTNAAFYTVFASSGAASYLLSSLVMLLSSDVAAATRFLFAALTVVAVCGVGLLACLPDPEDPSAAVLVLPLYCARRRPRPIAGGGAGGDGAAATEAAGAAPADVEHEEGVVAAAAGPGGGGDAPPPPHHHHHPPPPSLLYMLAFLTFRERRMRFVAPIIFAFGAMMGAFNAVYVGSFVAASAGQQYVGFVGLAYAVTNALSSWGWGRLSQRPGIGRRWAFVVAGAIHVAFYLGLAAWAHFFSLTAPALGADPPLSGRLAFFVVAAAVYAVADSVWYTLIPAMLQTFFSTGADAACANAAIRFYTAAGFACAAGASSYYQGAYVPQQMLAVAVLLVAACAALLYLHARVASVDARNERHEGTGQQSSRRIGEGAAVAAAAAAAGSEEAGRTAAAAVGPAPVKAVVAEEPSSSRVLLAK